MRDYLNDYPFGAYDSEDESIAPLSEFLNALIESDTDSDMFCVFSEDDLALLDHSSDNVMDEGE